MTRYVAYYRVSTAKQGRSGLGLEAQAQAVADYVRSVGGEVLGAFEEVESGRQADRPRLEVALRHCRATGAVLVVAKLDRLARDVAFLSNLMRSGVEFVAVDFPQANSLMIHVLAAVAEYEARCASERTRAALQAAKARGQRLGNPNGAAALRKAGRGNGAAVRSIQAKAAERAANLRDMVRDIQAGGVTTLEGIAAELKKRGARTARGGEWRAVQVKRILDRLAA